MRSGIAATRGSFKQFGAKSKGHLVFLSHGSIRDKSLSVFSLTDQFLIVTEQEAGRKCSANNRVSGPECLCFV